MATLDIVLHNHTDSESLFAHITGQNDDGLFMLEADGKTAYRPASPSDTLQPLGADTAIALGGPGNSKKVTVPHIAGGRIWFCKEKPLTFYLNPGPAVVEPSATNPSDPNYDVDWGFCEFTFNPSELYVNISYVDFVSLPVSLKLENEAGKIRTVPGMPKDGLDKVGAALMAQGKKDGAGWEKLVIQSPTTGQTLRALSPNSATVLIPGLFDNYYEHYVNEVWHEYKEKKLTVNTQFKWGDAKGHVDKHGDLNFKGVGSFAKPSAADIFSCNSGPFAHGAGVSEEMLNVGARLAAAFNRSTLLTNSEQPEGEKVGKYYEHSVTNHYARICHEVSLQSRGYAFPYDDVGPSSGKDQSGFLNDSKPKVLTVSVGKPMHD